MAASYSSFVHEPANALPSSFHRGFRECLHGIQADGFLARPDITQPMGVGTRLAKTRVTRCLIGKPGITYKYLGVRMFAHPWSGPQCTPACAAMRALSAQLGARAHERGGESNGFNLVLLNRMTPEAGKSAKQERDYGLGPVSVSWHADCSLRDFTTISVYVAQHPLERSNFELPAPPPRPPQPQPWRVALRVVRDAEGPTMRAACGALGERDRTTPAVLLPLHDGDAYHMLGDFNHHHQHAVMAGSSCCRYTSTHRCVPAEGHSFESIRARCERVLQAADREEARAAGSACSSKQWHEEGLCLAEVEFEWVRQFYVQGRAHRELHRWWHKPMEQLCGLWRRLHGLFLRRVATVQAAAAGKGGAKAAAGGGAGGMASLLECLVVLLGDLGRCQRMRDSWRSRCAKI